MDILIHTSDPAPVYEQIVRQIHEAIKIGRLKPGAPLPPVRQLAGDLSLNRNTVARAYRILEDQGVILTAGRKGTFVRHGAPHEVAKARSSRAERVLGRAVSALLGDGLTRDEITEIFTTTLKRESRKG
jgi:GntR family transcriptional regulator